MVGDCAYDAEPIDAALAELGIEMIVPHRQNRKCPKSQDGCPLRWYKRRWKVERLFAWLGNFRRLVVCYEPHALNYLGFVHASCILSCSGRVYEVACTLIPWDTAAELVLIVEKSKMAPYTSVAADAWRTEIALSAEVALQGVTLVPGESRESSSLNMRARCPGVEYEQANWWRCVARLQWWPVVDVRD